MTADDYPRICVISPGTLGARQSAEENRTGTLPIFPHALMPGKSFYGLETSNPRLPLQDYRSNSIKPPRSTCFILVASNQNLGLILPSSKMGSRNSKQAKSINHVVPSDIEKGYHVRQTLVTCVISLTEGCLKWRGYAPSSPMDTMLDQRDHRDPIQAQAKRYDSFRASQEAELTSPNRQIEKVNMRTSASF